ncbi:hypothetical protein ACH4OT_33360 [Streptomyces murinus]|uniref:hypothetical protein n=1 Tax=Streptomyces murinus TaxID=33900 RepID=UPI0037B59C43
MHHPARSGSASGREGVGTAGHPGAGQHPGRLAPDADRAGGRHLHDACHHQLEADLGPRRPPRRVEGITGSRILIRVEDRNVFIGECKIWNGPQAIEEAITQLLRYLVWRDSKAALLVFIRDTEPTSSIQKAIQKIEGHPNHRRTLQAREADGRYDFVLSANDDLEREIHLAFLPFVLPIKKIAAQN